MITKLQSIDSERLGNKEGSRSDSRISLGGRNRFCEQTEGRGGQANLAPSGFKIQTNSNCYEEFVNYLLLTPSREGQKFISLTQRKPVSPINVLIMVISNITSM